MAAFPWRFYVFVSTLFCLFLNNVQVVSAVSFFTPKSDGSIQVEGRPFQLQCIFDASDHLEIDLSQRTVIWKRPDKPPNELGVKIDDNSKYGSITFDRIGRKFLRSTLYVPEPPAYLTFQTAYYECELVPRVSSQVNSHNFRIKVLKAKAVPNITTPTLKPAKHEETVMLNCSVTYTNTDTLTSAAMLNLTWEKDMKKFGFKNVKYLQGTGTVSYNHPLTVRSSTDGGVYTCQWTLKHQSDEFRGQSSVFLSILPYLLGDKRKEVIKFAGDDVTLKCDVIGYPIAYKWTVENEPSFDLDKRITIRNSMLSIRDIDYKDRKEYIRTGVFSNTTLKQIIVLRVKDHDKRITIRNSTLSIKNIDVKDRNEYICTGKVIDTSLKQIIILRVKESVLGLEKTVFIIIVSVVCALVIAVVVIVVVIFCFRRRRENTRSVQLSKESNDFGENVKLHSRRN